MAAGAVRGSGDRRPLRHLRRPGEPREAERPHDRAPCGRPTRVVEAGRKRRGHLPRGRPGGRSHRRRGHTEPAAERAEPESRHPARRPARHRAIEPTRRRRDPVRDADGDGRPRRGAGSARLPAARRDRQLLRRHRGADLREPPSLLGAHAHPRRRDRDRRPLLRPLRPQRPARPRPTRETLRVGPHLPEHVPRLGAPVRRAREGVERRPPARHDRRRARLHRARDAARRDKGGLDPAGRQQRREGRLRAPRRRGLGRSRRRAEPHVRVDLVQRALDRSRCDGTLGHRLRQLHDGPDRGVPESLLLRPQARRAALALEAPRVQPRPRARPRGRRRPARPDHEPLRPRSSTSPTAAP